MKLNEKSKKAITASIAAAIVLALPVTAGAMHIMEGYLPIGHSIAWSAVSLPFMAAGALRLKRIAAENKRSLILLAMSGAFIFVISSLKIPSVTHSSSHMTGTGLAAILFGISATSVLGAIALAFQAVLLAHGGLTTLGANAFSAAIAGPFLSWLLFTAGKKLKLNKMAVIFVAVSVGDMFSYCVTSMQLAIAHPSETGGVFASAVKFLGVFAPTQLPLAIIEGFLTVLIIMGLENYAAKELAGISFMERK
jgi:cobalt/nickel transport system permease protein